MAWSGLEWTEAGWSRLEYLVVDWSGLEWPGVTWSGLEWPGVAWSGLERNSMKPFSNTAGFIHLTYLLVRSKKVSKKRKFHNLIETR